MINLNIIKLAIVAKKVHKEPVISKRKTIKCEKRIQKTHRRKSPNQKKKDGVTSQAGNNKCYYETKQKVKRVKTIQCAKKMRK